MRLNKKIKFLISICVLMCITIPIFAADNYDISEFESNGSAANSAGSLNNLVNNSLSTAINIVRIVGTGIALTIIAVIASKYMIASAGDRAEIKKNAVPFVIGAIILFGASNLITILIKIGEGF